MPKVLVTGSSGFIAPHVIESCLKSDYEVVGIDLKDPEIKLDKCKYIKGDVRNQTVNDLKDIDYIIHLAFITNIPNSIQNPVKTTDDNIDMTVDLLDKATKLKLKNLYFLLQHLFMAIILCLIKKICQFSLENRILGKIFL